MGRNLRYFRALLFLAITLCLAPCFPLHAEAYGSWIQDSEAYKDFYDSVSPAPETPTDSTVEEEGFLSQQIGNFIHFIGTLLRNILQDDSINLSIDGIILGRMAQPAVKSGVEPVSFTSFELTENNIYGVIGSTVYVIFRSAAYSGLFLYFLWLVATQMWERGSKARESFKMSLGGILLAFIMLYALPNITDLCTFLRDVMAYSVVTGIAHGGSLIDLMADAYASDRSIITGTLFTAMAGASFFYLKDYISIAVQQMALFGLSPVFFTVGVRKKKVLSDWGSLFFTNMFTPVIDAVFLIAPYMAVTITRDVLGISNTGVNIIIIFTVWSARASRNAVLKAFGSMTQTPAGRGLMGLAATAMMAARMLSRRGGGGMEKAPDAEEWKEAANERQRTAEDMDRYAREAVRDLPAAEEIQGTAADGEAGADAEELGESGGLPGPEDAGNGTDGHGDAGMEEAAERDRSLPEGTAGPDGVEEEAAGGEMADMDMAAADEKGHEGQGPLPEDGLSEFDARRLGNLEALDRERDLLEEDSLNLLENRAQKEELDRRMADTGQEISEKEKDLKSYEREMDSASRQYGRYVREGDQQAADAAWERKERAENGFRETQAGLDASKNGMRELQRRSMENGRERQELERTVSRREKNIQARTAAERSFAQYSQNSGMSGQSYTTARNMRDALHIREDRGRQAIGAKRISSTDILRDLSPEDAKRVADRQAARARHEVYRNMAQGALKAAAVGAGAVAGGSAAGFGGEDASLQAGLYSGISSAAAAGAAKKAAAFIGKEAVGAMDRIGGAAGNADPAGKGKKAPARQGAKKRPEAFGGAQGQGRRTEKEVSRRTADRLLREERGERDEKP